MARAEEPDEDYPWAPSPPGRPPGYWAVPRARRMPVLELFRRHGVQATFCGHVHVPAFFELSPTGKITGFEPVQSVEIPLLAQRRWVAVLGSVGQPRDYNPAACYGALDVERNVLTYVRVPYDNETAARKIREAGLPKALSDRLIEGL